MTGVSEIERMRREACFFEAARRRLRGAFREAGLGIVHRLWQATNQQGAAEERRRATLPC